MTRIASAPSQLQPVAQSRPAQRIRFNLGHGIIHLVLIACAVTMLFPLVWLVSTSLKSPGKQFIFPPELLPIPVYWQNYVDLFARIPMGRLGTPDDVASLVLFLAGDEAAYVTGQGFVVDGGMSVA